MDNVSIRPFINEVYNQKLSIDKIDEIYAVFETLKGFQGFKGVIEHLSNWLYEKYKIRNVKFETFDVKEAKRHVLFHKGLEIDMEEDEDLVYSFSIVIQPFLRGDLNLLFDSTEHFENTKEEFVYIDALLCETALVIKNTIINNFLQASSIKDSVTKAYNRKGLDEHLEKLLPLARRENKDVAFLSIGIDHYKAVIDEFDYKVGEQVLIALANILDKHTRTSDLVARIDSDEFVVVLANVFDSESAMMVAQKLISEFAACEIDVGVYSGQTLKKTICIGVSMFPDDSTSVEQLMKNADIALYEARNQGRSQVLRFEEKQEGMIDLF
jgi:two-component system cell cycle response regulator